MMVAGLLSVVFLSACSTTDKQTSSELAAPAVNEVAQQLQITNYTNAVVNTIKYKPCNAGKDVFLTLAENLKPKERVVFNLYDVCIDLKALNTFDDMLEEKSSLNLSQKVNWDIRQTSK